jgi:kumamolisin
LRNLFSRANSQRAAAVFTVVYVIASGLVTAAASAPADQPVPLHGNTVAGLASTDRVADEDPTRAIDIQLGLQLRNRAELEQLIRRVSTPSSPEYGHYLTPAQFNAQFGPSAAQVNEATGFLRANGLQVTSAVASSTIVDARGTVAQVEGALHTSIGRFHDRAGNDFFANDTEPALPASLAAFVTGIQGLNNRYQRHHAAVLPRVCPPTCASTPYTPTQIRQAYQLSAAPLTNLTGTGQTLGLLELDSFWQGNINGFTTTYGLPAITPTVQTVDSGSGALNSSGGQVEVELDIEVMHAIAPAASIQVFEAPNTDPGLIDAYGCMVNPSGNATCPNRGSGLISYTNSTSWGLCETLQLTSTTNAMASIFSQAATQGQSFFAASGDTGSDDCGNSTTLNPSKSVDSPASDLHMTGVGGTRLLLNTDNTYNSETAWPPRAANPTWGSGGGYSTLNARPVWQTGPGVDVSTGAKRQVPDISLDADPVTGYSIYTCNPAPCTSGGGLKSIGGTSAGAPAWAAFTAIYNQYAACQGQPKLGFANPVLYPFGVTPPTFTPFNDITTGDNVAGNPAGGYNAGAGYDKVTGLGTLRASDLAQDLAGTSTPVLKVSSLAKTVGVTGDTVHLFGCGFATSAGQVPSVTFGSHPSANVTYLDSNDLSVVAPFNFNGTVSVTVTNPAGAGGGSATLPNAFTYNQPPPPPPPAGGTSLYGTLLNGSGSGQVEVHALSQGSHYTQFSLHAATAFGPAVATDWQFFVAGFQGDGQPDLFGVHLRNTSSGRVEVHILSAASGYQTFLLHAASALAAVPSGQFQFALGSFAGDHRSNLYAIILSGTGSGTVEVHVLSEASNYATWVLHSASAFAQTSSSAWRFLVGDRFGSGDLIGVLHGPTTGSGKTEVHILSRASGYQNFTLHTATPLGYTNDSQLAYALGDHDNDGIPDIYAVLMNGSSSGQTEVHVLSGASNYTSFIEQTATGLGPTGTTNWQFSTH